MEGEKECQCGYDTPGITWKKDLKGSHTQQICLFNCIYSFSHKPTFNLQIMFKLTARGKTPSQEQANYPHGQRFQNLKGKQEKKKSEKMRDWLFIISILSVYLMRCFEHFEVKGSWSPQWLMQLDCLWGGTTRHRHNSYQQDWNQAF